MLMDNRTQRELVSDDFISQYLRSLPVSEVPMTFHRWACIVGLGAWIGRDAFFQHMDFKLYPNIYAMLLGDSGARKSTAIKQFNKLLKAAGYKNFVAQKTSKEQFLIDLAESNLEDSGSLTDVIFGDAGDMIDETRVSNMFAAPDEFNELFANNILEFVSMLGTLWDFDGVFENKVKNSKSVRIPNPCISLIGGNTPSTLYNTFPSEIIGQGFFSRVLFIHADKSDRKIAFPLGMAEEVKKDLVGQLQEMKARLRGQLDITPEAMELLEEIYNEWDGIDDIRFASYSTRRFTHLLKLLIIHTVADFKSRIDTVHVLRTNTVLSTAERFMPSALGEFGKAHNSDIIHKVMIILNQAQEPLGFTELWAHVQGDLNKLSDLQELMHGLLVSGRAQSVGGGFLPKKRAWKEMDGRLLCPEYMSIEERMKL